MRHEVHTPHEIHLPRISPICWRPPYFFPMPLFILLGVLLVGKWILVPLVGMLSFLLPLAAVIALVGFVVSQVVRYSGASSHKTKRKHGSTAADYFETEPTDDSNIIRTTDGKRYIRTETGEYKEVAE